MCSISVTVTFDKQAKVLSRSDREMIEKRLTVFANDANDKNPGGLDNPACRVKRFRDELSDVRKMTIGRHRVYYKGHHRQCSYHAFCIKAFKKTGVNDEDNPKFQDFLRRALSDPPNRELKRPDKSNKG